MRSPLWLIYEKINAILGLPGEILQGETGSLMALHEASVRPPTSYCNSFWLSMHALGLIQTGAGGGKRSEVN